MKKSRRHLLSTSAVLSLVSVTSIANDSSPTPTSATPPRFARSTPTLRSPQPLPEIPPQSPAQFNPDPGEWNNPKAQTVEDNLANPLFPEGSSAYGTEPLPTSLRLPRDRVIGLDPIKNTLTYREYPLGREGLGLLPQSKAGPSRWQVPFPHWQRYHDPSRETPYMYETPRLWHPYKQSLLKGDLPIHGEDIFVNLTAKNFSIFEYRRLPVPSGVSTAQPNSSEFFGRGEQVFFSNDTSLSVDIFKGETAFKPITWLVRLNLVQNQNWLRVRENNLVNVSPLGTDNLNTSPPPKTGTIQAVPLAPNSVNPVGGDPGSFTSTVNPEDLFNYLAPELQPLGDAQPLTPIVPPANPPATTQAKPPKKTKNQNDFAGSRYTRRHREFTALQEAFVEVHITDLSDNYDFIAARVGTQPFVSDFRGFIFADSNLGARIFGNADNNRLQYNLALFNMWEKDTYSDLNTFDSRHQQVLIANLYRQDFLWKGYTAQASFHMNLDGGSTRYDKIGFLTRPEPFGTVPAGGDSLTDEGGPLGHDVKAFYLGWTGDGHIGRWNLTHAFYQVFGRDELNPFAGQEVSINAQMAALELSYDRDWVRFKLSGFYASGDNNPTDDVARGFDSILDHPLFVGGPFSWYVHQGFNLAGTGVGLKQRDSLIPNLRTSKTQGQSNFVNPGVMIVGVGSDIDVTPKLKAFINLNYIWLAETKPIEFALQTNRIRNDLGLDASVGIKFRPLLTDNIVVSLGVGLFMPGGAYRDIYRQNTIPVPGFGAQSDPGQVDKVLYNGFMAVTFLY